MTSSPSPVGVRIAGTGIAIPPRVLTNQDLEGMVDTNDQWITQRTGIQTRHIVEGDVTTRDLAVQAMQGALVDAHMEPGALDMVLVATLTPEMCCPSTAARVVDAIGAIPAGALDISAACSGFVYGMNVASSLIQSGMYASIGVVGAETLSRITNWEDRGTCILFADGAGAAIFTACDDPKRGCLFQKMNSDGSRWPDLYCPRQASDLPPDPQGFSGKFNTLQMNGREVYKFAVTNLLGCIRDTLGACGLEAGDLAMIVAHQSNKRILESARDRLGLLEEKLYINIDRYGNTSAASVPICLHELRSAGRIRDGDLVLFTALGGGMTWTSSLWRL